MDLDLKAELLLAGGYQAALEPRVIARILAWERACQRRGFRVYITKPVGDRAKEGAFAIYGGGYMRSTEERAVLRVRW